VRMTQVVVVLSGVSPQHAFRVNGTSKVSNVSKTRREKVA
jgi:hypothetical protein